MKKADIIEKLSKIASQEVLTSDAVQSFEDLKQNYKQLILQHNEEQKAKFIEEGGNESDFVPQKDDEDSIIESHLFNIESKSELTSSQSEVEESQSVKSEEPKETSAASNGVNSNDDSNKHSHTIEEAIEFKTKLIHRLDSILKTDVKNLGKNFKTASEIQDEWKSSNHKNSKELHDLEVQYKAKLDEFYYKAKIVKDSIELDYEKNKEAKDKVIEKILLLKDETNVRNLEQKIRQYEKEWFRVGPVKKEIREESKQQLEAAVLTLQPTLDKLYENEKELLAENLKKKISICEQLNGVLGKEFKSPKQFQQASDTVIQLQSAWKEIGRSDENDRIWEVFRSACDNFFNAKRDFFKNLADNRKINKQAKLDLITKAEEVKESTDWKKTSNYLISLQKEWKSIGPAHPSEDQKLWVQFRSICDTFFDARSAFYADQDKEYDENLRLKKDLIQKLETFALTGNTRDDINKLQEFEKEYSAIGFVPFKQKDKIHRAFFETLNTFYDALNVDRNDKVKMRFTNRIKSMATGNKPERTLNFEENKIRQRIGEVKQQLASYANNVSFTKGNENNPFVKSIKKNIRDAERELDHLKLQLQLIKDAKSGKLTQSEEE